MSQENVELIQMLLEHFVATGEPDWSTLDEKVEVHDHDIMDAGEYREHTGVGRWLEDWGAAWSEYSSVPEEFFDAGDRVVAVMLVKAIGKGSGVAVERQDAQVYTVRDGKVVRLDYCNSKDQGLKAAGLTG